MADKTTDSKENEPSWLQNLSQRLDRIESIGMSVKSTQETSIPSIEKSIKDLQESINEMNAARKKDAEFVTDLSTKVAKVQDENVKLKHELKQTKDRMVYLESQSRRNNLIITGIEEIANESWGKTEEKVSYFFKNTLEIPDTRDIKIERAHRVGSKENQKSRNIIVKFLSFKDKQCVLEHRKKLEGKPYNLLEDYPLQIQNNRKQLWPIYKFAKGSTDFKEVSLNLDKLFINKKLFTTENLHELPPSLKPENRAVKTTDDTVVFFSKNTVFSNFNAADVQIEGVKYCCNEQYFQYCKAATFGDTITANAIMQETDPLKICHLGKRVKGYKKDFWDQKAYDILKRVNFAKYAQNPPAKQALQDTGDRKIGEASLDLQYGTGVAISSRDASDATSWKGQNWMGKILTEIRKAINDDTL